MTKSDRHRDRCRNKSGGDVIKLAANAFDVVDSGDLTHHDGHGGWCSSGRNVVELATQAFHVVSFGGRHLDVL